MINDFLKELHREALMEHTMAMMQARKRQAPRFAAALLASAVWLLLIIRAWAANGGWSGLLVLSALGMAATTWLLWAFFWGFPLYSAAFDAAAQIRSQIILLTLEEWGYEKPTTLLHKDSNSTFNQRVGDMFDASGFFSNCNQYQSDDALFQIALPNGCTLEWCACKGNVVNGNITRSEFSGLVVALRWKDRLPWIQDEVVLINEKISGAKNPFKPAKGEEIPLFEQHPSTGYFIYANQPTTVYSRLQAGFWLKLKELWGSTLWEEGAKCLAVRPDGLYFTFDRYAFYNYANVPHLRRDLESEDYMLRLERELQWLVSLAKLKEEL